MEQLSHRISDDKMEENYRRLQIKYNRYFK